MKGGKLGKLLLLGSIIATSAFADGGNITLQVHYFKQK